MLDITDKNFKAAVINMFKELKDIMSEELKESMMTMSYETEKINTEIEVTKQNQVEILKLKITITEIRKITRGTQQQFWDGIRKNINKLEDK